MVKFIADKETYLDAFLRENTTKGLRWIKQTINEKRILVNGIICKKRKKIVQRGDLIEILEQDVCFDIKPMVIKGNNLIYGAVKPPFVHSAKGKNSPNMEDILEKFYNKKIYLLNRLDFLTSGILLFGFSEKSKDLYLSMQNIGAIEKKYIAIVHGKIQKKFIVKNKINQCKRKKVLVFNEQDKDINRHTIIIPKKFFKEENKTLVEAIIKKGKRHQIRAHLSYIGHPIVGDPLYGRDKFSLPRMYLHNFMVKGMDFEIKIKRNFNLEQKFYEKIFI